MFFGRSLIAVSLLVLVCLSGCAGGRGARGNDLSERPWVLVTTDNFRVYSDLDADRVKTLAVGLEKDLHLIAQAAFGGGGASIEKTEVIVFSRDAHFHRYFSKSIGGISYRAPLLPERPHTVVTVKGLSRQMWHTLRHELVHDLFAKNFGRTPTWLSEGFAEYFSTVQLVGSEIHVGKALPNRTLTNNFEPIAFGRAGFTVLAIPDRMIPPPTELLQMSAQEFYVWDSDSYDEAASLRAAANYFGAWAFVHFLMDAEGEHSTRFNRFLREVKTASVAGAWQGAFGDVKGERLNEDFRSYLSAGNLSVGTTPYQEFSVRQAPQVRALATGEKHVLLAKLALAPTRVVAENEALFLEHVDAAVRSGPPPPEAYYLRGVFAASQGKDADADRDFKSAVQLAPKDPRFLRASLGHQLATSGKLERSEFLRRFRPEVVKLEALATSSLDLLLAAQFFAGIGETDRALMLGDKAASRAPVDPVVLSKYATVLEWCGLLDDAIAAQRLALEFVYEQREFQKQLGADLKRLESLAEREKKQVTVLDR